MPLASQWLGHWNRASRHAHWQLRHRSHISRQFSSSTWKGNEVQYLYCASGDDPIAVKARSSASQRKRGAAGLSRSADNLTNGPPELRCIPLSENDLHSFKWNDFVHLTRETTEKSSRFWAQSGPIPGQKYDASELCHELVVAQRTAGHEGVLRVWSRLVEQKGLTKVEGTDADFFYQGVLEAALPNDTILEGIKTYADWLVDEHGIRWPHLYDRVVSYCMESRQYKRAFRWHFGLMANFDPGKESFTALILRHVHQSDPGVQETLRSMYVASHHRTLYDDIIPHLYRKGSSALSMDWRDLLARFNDLPQHPSASQPFLYFLRAFYHGKSLAPQEEVLASSETRYHATLPRKQEYTDSTPSHWLSPTPANDAIGARLLASSWIGPEFAVHALQGLGVYRLGPLSLQSLALREPSPASVLGRLKQLERLGIDIGESTYVKSIRYFAETNNDELLLSLLHSDIHPEVFDDAAVRSQILTNAVATGDWRTSKLLLAIQPAVALHSMQTTSNTLLRHHLLRCNTRSAIELLADMRAMNVDMEPETLDTIYNYLLDATAPREPISAAAIQGVHGSIDLARSVISSQRMIPSKIWRNLFHQLGQSGQQTALENLALAIVDGYQLKAAEEGGLMGIHQSDLPPWSTHLKLTDVPMDLPTSHPWHPISRILGDRKLQISIIRWGFKAGLPLAPTSELQSVADTSPIKEFYVARGARLLQQLANRGITLHLQGIRDEIISCMASHIDFHGSTGVKASKNIPWASLPEVRHLFASALGRNLLPQTPALRLLLHAKSRHLERKGTKR